MSNDDVREAFNICVSGGENPDCDTCPYKDIYDYRECFIVLRRHALELINRQKAEIERLKKPTSASAIQISAEQAVNSVDRTPQFISKIKAEAIREFVERLKECCYHNDDLSNDDCLSITSDINCILKEMVGDNDDKQ